MKYTLVSGTSSGIGYSTALKLIENGYFVFGVDLSSSKIETPGYIHIQCDLTKEESLKLIDDSVSKVTQHIDGVFNIAGVFMFESIVEGSSEDLKKIIDINFFAVYRLNKMLLKYLDNSSKILIITSEVARYSPQPFNGYYTLSKVILDKYADVLRRELNYLGIKVIKIQSGAIRTNLLSSVNSKYDKILSDSVYYKKPLIKLKKLMDDEINKQIPVGYLTERLVKIFTSKRVKICYRIKNSFKLSFLSCLPEKVQDYIYLKVIK